MIKSRRSYAVWAISALLMLLVAVIIFLGLAQSDWLYGTYGQIDASQWQRIEALRDRLAEWNRAPGAVAALDGALLIPHPSTEQVFDDLKQAASALDALENAAAHAFRMELYGLMAEINPSFRPPATPWVTPTPWPTPKPTPFDEPPIA
jgi:hypothetical protein